MLLEMQSAADGIQDPREPVREHPAPGTPFWFEVIESFNAKDQGDTAGHIGRGGGLLGLVLTVLLILALVGRLPL